MTDAGPMSDPVLVDDGLCFGCGPHNPIGLHLTFAWNGDLYVSQWTPLLVHQGWAGRVHGGLLAAVLDETLSRAALERHGLCWVTAELVTRLVRPARIGVVLRLEAQIDGVRPRLLTCSGRVVEDETGAVVAAGAAKLMRPREA